MAYYIMQQCFVRFKTLSLSHLITIHRAEQMLLFYNLPFLAIVDELGNCWVLITSYQCVLGVSAGFSIIHGLFLVGSRSFSEGFHQLLLIFSLLRNQVAYFQIPNVFKDRNLYTLT